MSAGSLFIEEFTGVPMPAPEVQPEPVSKRTKKAKGFSDPIQDAVCTHLIHGGFAKCVVNNLQPKHCKAVHERLPEGLWCEWFERLLEEKRAHKPIGVFAKYNHPYKYTEDMVITAILRVEARVAAELGSDPFADEDAPKEWVQPIFDGRAGKRLGY